MQGAVPFDNKNSLLKENPYFAPNIPLCAFSPERVDSVKHTEL